MRTLSPRRRRAFVALGLAIATLVATPAFATITSKFHVEISGGCSGTLCTESFTDLYKDEATNAVYMSARTHKIHTAGLSWSDADHKICVETWSKPDANRAPDVTVACRHFQQDNNNGDTSPLHFVNSNGTPGAALAYTTNMLSDNIWTIQCRVDGLTFARTFTGSNPTCVKASNLTTSQAQGIMSNYINRSWDSIYWTMNGARPEVQSWEIERLWQMSPDFPTSIAYMKGGDNLFSLNGTYILIMQDDGNLVLYTRSTMTALWSSGTSAYPGAYLVHQDDGNLVVYDVNGVARWNSNTSCGTTCNTPKHMLLLGNDGTLKLRSDGWGGTVLWQKP